MPFKRPCRTSDAEWVHVRGVSMHDHAQPPYAAPMPPPPPAPFSVPRAPAVDRDSLRDLAKRQRTAIIAGCANAIGGVLAYSHALPTGAELILELVVAGFIIVAAYRLAARLHGVGIAILAAIAMLIPILWIVVLVVLSARASRQLRAAGLRVGFFGVDPSSI
jgi:hypothetical protein